MAYHKNWNVCKICESCSLHSTHRRSWPARGTHTEHLGRDQSVKTPFHDEIQSWWLLHEWRYWSNHFQLPPHSIRVHHPIKSEIKIIIESCITLAELIAHFYWHNFLLSQIKARRKSCTIVAQKFLNFQNVSWWLYVVWTINDCWPFPSQRNDLFFSQEMIFVLQGYTHIVYIIL